MLDTYLSNSYHKFMIAWILGFREILKIFEVEKLEMTGKDLGFMIIVFSIVLEVNKTRWNFKREQQKIIF